MPVLGDHRTQPSKPEHLRVKGDMKNYVWMTSCTETALGKAECTVPCLYTAHSRLWWTPRAKALFSHTHFPTWYNLIIPLQWCICVYLSGLISAQQESPLVVIEKVSSLACVSCYGLDSQVHRAPNRPGNSPLSPALILVGRWKCFCSWAPAALIPTFCDAQVGEWRHSNPSLGWSHCQGWVKTYFLRVPSFATPWNSSLKYIPLHLNFMTKAIISPHHSCSPWAGH